MLQVTHSFNAGDGERVPAFVFKCVTDGEDRANQGGFVDGISAGRVCRNEIANHLSPLD